MAKITNSELVDKIFMFCEAYSGVKLFPYQAQFAKRIIRSLIENDGDEITALFSRQCIEENQKILMGTGQYVPIKMLKKGDIIRGFDYDSLVDMVVSDIYCSGIRDLVEVEFSNGKKLYCTPEHKLLNWELKLFIAVDELGVGRNVVYFDKDKNKIKKTEIVSIKSSGYKNTYDIEVYGAENFCAESIITHNSGKSETVATISGGLAMILPALANNPMFVTDTRLQLFKDGVLVGIFAPVMQQAQTTFARIKQRIQSKHAQIIMSDPDININFSTNNGQNVVLSNGSIITCMSASEGSNIESKSYMMIIVDEAQDVGNFKFSKCLASTTEIWTPDGNKHSIKDVVENKMDVVTLDGKRTPIEFYNNGIFPVYELSLANGRKIEATKNHQFYVRRRIGNRIPIWDTVDNISIGDTIAVPKKIPYFGDKYNKEQGILVGLMLGDGCTTGSSPMLCMDKEVRDTIPDLLINFDNTEYKESVYTESKDLSEGYFKRVSREGNREGEFKTFLKSLGIWGLKGAEKTITPEIFSGSKEFLKGLVLGLIESDGCVSNNEIVFSSTSEGLVRGFQDILIKFGVPSRVSVRKQNGNLGRLPVWNCVIKNKEGILKFSESFKLLTEAKQNKLLKLVEKFNNKKGNRKVVNDKRRGKFRDDIYFERVVSKKLIGEKPTYCLKVEGRNFIANGIVSSNSISPMGAFYNATKILVGTPSVQKGFFYDSIQRNKRLVEIDPKKRNHFEYSYKTVIKYNPRYEKYIRGEIARMGENSDEFQMSYNLKWLLERGMFVSEAIMNKASLSKVGLCENDRSKVHVVGIDCGKENDSTVVTVIEVDFETPVVVELSKDAGVSDFVVYDKTIKSWLEIMGDDWNSQYYQIMDYLSNFKVVRVVIDATGVGSPLADRLAANVDFEVIPYVFSLSAKSDLYKHFDTELKAGRFKYPANTATQDTVEFRKFVDQMLSLNKFYNGQHMICKHPESRGARDDFPDSAALACWAAKGAPITRPIMERNPFSEKEGFAKNFYNNRNKITAARRG